MNGLDHYINKMIMLTGEYVEKHPDENKVDVLRWYCAYHIACDNDQESVKEQAQMWLTGVVPISRDPRTLAGLALKDFWQGIDLDTFVEQNMIEDLDAYMDENVEKYRKWLEL